MEMETKSDSFGLNQIVAAIELIPEIQQALQQQNQLLEEIVHREAVPTLLTMKEAAAKLRVRPCTLYKWASEGRITVSRIGGNKFRSEDLLTFIAKNTIRGRRN
jgi:excisionase family DNA binding protein